MSGDMDQTSKVDTLREITGLESEDEAKRRLEYVEWDLQQAVEMFLAGREIPPIGASNLYPTLTSQPRGQVPSHPTDPRALTTSSSSPAFVPRGQPREQNAADPSQSSPLRILLRIVFFPFRAAVSLVSFLSNTITRLLGLGPLLVENESPRDANERFLSSFQSDYGDVHPRFYRGTYGEALRTADRQFKFLLVYLHSDRHPRTGPFCRQVLAEPAITRLVEESFVFWAGSIRSQEGAGAQHALGLSTFPFLAVVSPQRGREYGRVVAVCEGLVSSNDVRGFLAGVLDGHGMSLVAARLEQEERITNRRLIQEQNIEYQRSLEADRERERRKAEEDAKREKDEREAQLREEERQRLDRERRDRREQKRRKLQEPEPEKGDTVASIVLRLPNGSRVSRRFLSSAPLRDVFDWADVQGVEIALACLASNFPRRLFNYPEDADISIEDANLTPSATLLVEERSIPEVGPHGLSPAYPEA
uniref:UBX domain-containing protein n=2 Tax=Compsopogon caeruleus TaxID=31354 RepID=A0A7S1XDM9_9RHOD|mmetsp:Transcript_18057/g.37488  ORF Transcript_18057/g.37488 Transcript_18057/m.37488 type:complete len:476 (+) Transcript_18057:129-1556(+)|eukprot:CAMPEP_0184679498 /NCGR_PEP_ID=MMETSP0312-20130426/2336_1 /TAXON_ID=31354 /ORGANISM="Compsopogon coeruleus, Strain SAG 36.94" /LENGTH=475 /DNA_ID=CAMNT_0027128985 /DNA_START=117 /DNA_END=1544 /DNA_ORIENTATION=+